MRKPRPLAETSFLPHFLYSTNVLRQTNTSKNRDAKTKPSKLLKNACSNPKWSHSRESLNIKARSCDIPDLPHADEEKPRISNLRCEISTTKLHNPLYSRGFSVVHLLFNRIVSLNWITPTNTFCSEISRGETQIILRNRFGNFQTRKIVNELNLRNTKEHFFEHFFPSNGHFTNSFDLFFYLGKDALVRNRKSLHHWITLAF